MTEATNATLNIGCFCFLTAWEFVFFVCENGCKSNFGSLSWVQAQPVFNCTSDAYSSYPQRYKNQN